MKKKILAILSSVLLLLAFLFFGQNIYFKNTIEKHMSISLKQKVSIKRATLNIFNNSFELKDTVLLKDNILIDSIQCQMNFKEFLKNRDNFTIDNLNITGITLDSDLKTGDNSSLTPNDVEFNNEKTTEFLKEIDKKIQFENNLSKFFKSSFNRDNFSKTLSNNLIDFLIKNVDYIDIIIQKEFNLKFKKQIAYFSERSKEILTSIKNSANLDTNSNILIKNISFNGSLLDIKFHGTLKNLNTNLSKNMSLPIDISLSQGDSIGKIYGDINTKLLIGNIYINLYNFNIESFKKINNYVLSGAFSSEQLITISGETLKIDGTSKIDNLKLNRGFILESQKLDEIKKNILKEIINLTEQKYHTLTVSNNFSNNMEIVTIKTSIPMEVKRTLIVNRQSFNDFLESQLKSKYENTVKEKKNKIKNFFKNIF